MSQGLLDIDGHEDQDDVLRLGELWELIHAALSPVVGRRFRLRATIASFKISRDNHVFFDLIQGEETGGTSKRITTMLPAVIWGSAHLKIARRLEAEGFGRLGNDQELVFLGKVVASSRYGKLQFQVDDVDVQALKIDAMVKLEEIRAKLRSEGIWSFNRSLGVTEVPLRVALVTSPTGAVKTDFLRPIYQSGLRFQVQFFPTGVAGASALIEIPRAIAEANKGDFDVIVLVRGGGSAGDLATFNEEPIVRAVAASSLPVWTAIGHSTDRGGVLVDEVANRAFDVTQSIATHLINTAMSYLGELEAQQIDIANRANVWILQQQSSVSSLVPRLASVANDQLARAREITNEVGLGLQRLGEKRLQEILGVLMSEQARMANTAMRTVSERFAPFPQRMIYEIERASEQALLGIAGQISDLGIEIDRMDIPLVLGLGFVMVTSDNGHWLRSSSQIGTADELQLVFRDGTQRVRSE